MNRSARRLIVTIGALSAVAGIYSAANGAEFSEYMQGMFLGVTLIGSALYYKEKDIDHDGKNSDQADQHHQ